MIQHNETLVPSSYLAGGALAGLSRLARALALAAALGATALDLVRHDDGDCSFL